MGRHKFTRLVSAAEAALAAGTAQLARDLLDEIDEELLDPVSRGRYVTVGADYSLFAAAPGLSTAAAQMLVAADLFHGEDDGLEQRSLVKAWEWALPAERHATGFEWDDLGRRLLAGADVKEGDAATILRGLSAIILKPYREAAPIVREALDAFDAMGAEALLEYGHSVAALGTYLWDLEARNRILERWATWHVMRVRCSSSTPPYGSCR